MRFVGATALVRCLKYQRNNDTKNLKHTFIKLKYSCNAQYQGICINALTGDWDPILKEFHVTLAIDEVVEKLKCLKVSGKKHN